IDGNFVGPAAGVGRRLRTTRVDQLETTIGGGTGRQPEICTEGCQIGFGGWIVVGVYEGDSLTSALVLDIDFAEAVRHHQTLRAIAGGCGGEGDNMLKRGMRNLLQQIRGLSRQGKCGSQQSSQLSGERETRILRKAGCSAG